MMISTRSLGACTIALALFAPTSSFAVSFDCSKAQNYREKAVCTSGVLGKLDDQLSVAYQGAEKSWGNQQYLKESQRQWLAELNRCGDEACIGSSYRTRIAELDGSDTMGGEEGEGGEAGQAAPQAPQELARATNQGAPSPSSEPSELEEDPDGGSVDGEGTPQNSVAQQPVPAREESVGDRVGTEGQASAGAAAQGETKGSGLRWVVSDTTADGGFVDNGDGTISDKETGLMWEKKSRDGSVNDAENKYTWPALTSDFLARLNAGSGFANHTDWRIPTIQELDTLRNFRAASPYAYPAFQHACAPGCGVTACSCTQPDYYWTNTTYQGWQQNAWGVAFGRVHTGQLNREKDSNYVRVVRSET